MLLWSKRLIWLMKKSHILISLTDEQSKMIRTLNVCRVYHNFTYLLIKNIYFLFINENNVVGTHSKYLSEMLPMSTSTNVLHLGLSLHAKFQYSS